MRSGRPFTNALESFGPSPLNRNLPRIRFASHCCGQIDLQLTMRHTPDVSSAVVSTAARARDSATRFHLWRVGLIFLSAGGYLGNNLQASLRKEVRLGTWDPGHESAPRCFP